MQSYIRFGKEATTKLAEGSGTYSAGNVKF